MTASEDPYYRKMSVLNSVCRLCLAMDVRMLTISGPLKPVFEKISDNALYTLDGRPVAACYICYAQLNKCHKLMKTAARAENVLNAIAYNDSKITVQSVASMDRNANGLCFSLTVSGAECFETIPRQVPQIKAEPVSDSEESDGDSTSQGPSVVDNNKECDSDEEDPISLVPRVTLTDVITEIYRDEEDEEIDVGQDDVRQAPQTVNLEGNGNCSEDSSERVQEEQSEGAEKSEAGEFDSTRRVHNESKKPKSLVEQTAQRTNEKLFQCKICRKNFTTEISLNDHLDKEDDTCHECSICSRKYHRKDSLIKHKKTHGDTLFHCHLCSYKSYYRSNLKCHMRQHDKHLKKFKCSECHLRFTAKGPYLQHLETHEETTATFQNGGVLTVTGVNVNLRKCTKLYECNYCYARFDDKRALASHKRRHSNEKPLECRVCKRRFTYRRSLSSHLRRHEQDKAQYTCDICKSQFKLMVAFRRHVITAHW